MALASLRGEREFRRVRRLGVSVRHPLFTLKVALYRPRYGQPWQPAMHIGIVVPKKVLKHAVDRNRVRRRVREALRTLPASAWAQPLTPCQGILFPTEAVLHVPFAELQGALAGAVAQVPQRVKAAGKSSGKRKSSAPARAKTSNHQQY